jgi:hypothetical protein
LFPPARPPARAAGRLHPARPAASPDAPKSAQAKHRGTWVLRRKRLVSPVAEHMADGLRFGGI